MIQKIQPDTQKARSLRRMAILTLERLQKTEKEKYPSNTLIDYYDTIQKLLEALNCLDGIKIKGEGAHQIIIDYNCSNYKLNEATRIFLQELRDYRNRISYEGFNITSEYIKTNILKIEKIIQQLIQLVDQKLKS